jgi:hypothetical protein
MKIVFRTLMTTVFVVPMMLTAGAAQAQDAQACQPGIGIAYFGPHSAQYQAIIAVMVPRLPALGNALAAVSNQVTYQTLLDEANALAGDLATGRAVITLPDGTVMIDTARDDNTAAATSNSYQHFLDKTINENHNSRLAILAAQEYSCGVGIESKLSTTTGQTESYVAFRLGNHLDSLGTVRMSIRQ